MDDEVLDVTDEAVGLLSFSSSSLTFSKPPELSQRAAAYSMGGQALR